MSQELWRESAASLASMIRAGDVTSREVIDAHLERIDAVNGALNAVVEVRADEVRREADRADAKQREGAPLAPLHGVPFTIKTNIDVAGYATTQGTTAMKDVMAASDAPTVERMRLAGAVALARTNMPDLGLRVNTESSLYGAAHNPWRHGYTTAGSSGGEAASIASGMSPIGLGNDIGGSLRNPAFACGIASIKPSRGRVPQGNPSSLIDMPINSQIMLVEGLLARHVGDLRIGLEAVMGAHRSDPQSLSAPLDGPVAPRRVAMVPAPSGGTTDPAIADAVRSVGAVLQQAGYEVEELEPPKLFESYFAWSELMMTCLEVERPMFESLLGDGGRRFLELTSLLSSPSTPESLYAMHQFRYGVASTWREFLTRYPLIVGPTWTEQPFPHGFDIESAESAMSVIERVRFVLPANVLGLPAVCVPTGVANGLPTGVQIIGDSFREDLCLDAAQIVEESMGVLTPIDPRD